jgi:hypothetical protein
MCPSKLTVPHRVLPFAGRLIDDEQPSLRARTAEPMLPFQPFPPADAIVNFAAKPTRGQRGTWRRATGRDMALPTTSTWFISQLTASRVIGPLSVTANRNRNSVARSFRKAPRRSC